MSRTHHARAAVIRRLRPTTPYLPEYGLNPPRKRKALPTPSLKQLDEDISDLFLVTSGAGA